MVQNNNVKRPSTYITKNKAGLIIGFVLGVSGFLLMFKIIFLNRIPPEDEVAPGIVVIASILNGVFFAFVGRSVQNHFGRRNAEDRN